MAHSPQKTVAMPPDAQSTQLFLNSDAGTDTDAEELDRLTRQLVTNSRKSLKWSLLTSSAQALRPQAPEPSSLSPWGRSCWRFCRTPSRNCSKS